MPRVLHRAAPPRIAVTAASVAIALLAAAAWPAAATTPAVTPSVGMFVHGPCVDGRNFQGGGSIKVVQKRSGNQIATVTISTGATAWSTCLKPFLAGDQVVVTETVASSQVNKRTITVPSLTLTLDPATDVESGHAPNPGSLVGIGVIQMIGGIRGLDISFGANTDGSGDFSHDWTGSLDVGRGDVAKLFWYSPQGDTIIVTSAAPSVTVEVGKAAITGTGPYTSVTTRIRTSTGTLRGTATGTVTGTESALAATFKSGGNPVKVKAGDVVTSSRISGSYKVRASNLVVKKAGNGSLTATCATGSQYAIALNGVVTVTGKAGTGGAISSTNVSKGTGPLFVGSTVQLGWRLASGFGQVFSAVVK